MRKRAVIFIGIVGGSGSGKSWLAEKIAKRLGTLACTVSLDDFYRDRSILSPARRGRINFDTPGAIDWMEVASVLTSLKTGNKATLPRYDFKTHCRLASTRTISRKQVIIIEGLWLFRRPELRGLFELKVFLECSSRTRLLRRIRRDTIDRGRTIESVKRQFHKTVQPMYTKYVEPQRKWADVIISEACTNGEINALMSRIVGERSARSASATTRISQEAENRGSEFSS